jgi:hypothetical protein
MGLDLSEATHRGGRAHPDQRVRAAPCDFVCASFAHEKRKLWTNLSSSGMLTDMILDGMVS